MRTGVAFAAAGLLGLTVPAAAQQVGGLRGAVDESTVNGVLVPPTVDAATTAATGLPSPAYQPVSPGAVPDDPAPTASIFDDAPLGDEPLPRPPTTARARAQDRQAPPIAQPGATVEDEPSTVGTVPEPTVDAEAFDQLRAQPTGERAQAIENLDRPPDVNPYAPVGLRLGSFDVFPSMETGLTATSNADFSSTGTSALVSETTLRLRAISDWSRNEARLNAFGTFQRSISGQELKETDLGVDAAADYQIGTDMVARASLAYLNRPESAASPVIIEDTVSQPTHQTFTGTAGVEKLYGKARFGLNGEIVHDTYGDADLAGGGTVSQADRDATLYAVTLRGGYEVSAVMTPFLEGELGRLVYDENPDSAGYDRSGNRYAIRGGLAFDRGEKLTGEFAAGYVEERLDDERLAPISGPSLQANVNWSPERGTNVNLFGGSYVEGTTTPGESGSILYLARLMAERQIRENLTGQAILGVGYRNYAGMDDHDWLFNAEANTTWWLNRYLGVNGRVQYESVDSTIPGHSTETTSVFLGLKLQR
ncbi:MAG: outer membrane beta-barrel protein [Rhizobiaceae bacterium]|nr:outer membrane beta-barrel protein [Rhizobiaceae bacterium]